MLGDVVLHLLCLLSSLIALLKTNITLYSIQIEILNKHLTEMLQTKASYVFTRAQFMDISVFSHISVDEQLLEAI